MRFGEQISDLLHSCLGPRGRPKLLSPSSVISSSSRRLLPLLHSSSPFARIVLRAAKTLEDGGLSCACLALQLASKPPPLPLAGGLIYEYLAAQFLLILETEVAFDVDFGAVHELMCVVRPLVSSKPACSLGGGDTEVVCSLVLRAFLEAVPSGVVGMAGVLGQAPTHSTMVHGVVVPLAEGDEERLRHTLSAGPFRACLFSGSLAGEVEWPAEVLVASKISEVEAAFLRHISSVVEMAVEEGVRVFLCQKVVHPQLKKRLHSAKVVVVDRLGGESATRIRGILGESCGEEFCHGTVSRGRVECLGRSRFLVLSSPDRTILLTHHNQEALAELEVVCRQSVSALFRLLVRPRVCFGGGCSEITAALLLANKVRGSLDAICSETSCTPGLLLCCLESFVRSVAHLCSSIHQGALVNFATDSISGHLWQQSADKCACGNRDAASVTDWRQLTDLAGLGDILLMSQNVLPLDTSSGSTSSPLLACSSSVASTSVDNLVPPVPQNAFASFVPQTKIHPSEMFAISVPSTSLSQNGHKVINPSMTNSVRVSNGRVILLDEFGCKRNSLSLAFETSGMLLKTTECIHTSPLAEETKVFS